MASDSEAGSEAGSGVMGSGSTVSTSAMVPVLVEKEVTVKGAGENSGETVSREARRVEVLVIVMWSLGR